ncbi:MAG: VTT domain-containing protein [Patescibacteria group bacterium]
MKKILNSAWFKRVYFAVSLALLGIGLYSVFDPEPFLKFGYFGIFVFNALGGVGTFLIPVLSSKMNIVLLALATATGMGINDSIAWLAGRGSSEAVYKVKWADKAERFLDKHGWKSLFVLSALPLPYDAIGLVSGYLGMDYLKFFMPTVSGKFIRMLLIGYGYQWLISL